MSSQYLAVISPYQLSDSVRATLKTLGFPADTIQRVTIPFDRDGIEVWRDDQPGVFVGAVMLQ